MLRLSRRKLLPLLAGAVGLGRLSGPGSAMAEEDAFPADFVWGASTSSYQIEGAVEEDGRGQSIWDVYSHSPGRVKGGDTGDVACDHYHRWVEDIEWLARGGFNAYRFSTAWPRILPAGTGTVEHRGLDFYDRLVDGLITRGITPWLCLYHWDLPQALQERGGWVNRDSAGQFADYATIVARRLGDRVKHWAMFNEANVHALFGYGAGGHAPGLTGLPNMLAATHHQNWRRAARCWRCVPSAPIFASVPCSTCRRCGRRQIAKQIGAARTGMTRSGTAPFSIRCSRASIRRPLPVCLRH